MKKDTAPTTAPENGPRAYAAATVPKLSAQSGRFRLVANFLPAIFNPRHSMVIITALKFIRPVFFMIKPFPHALTQNFPYFVFISIISYNLSNLIKFDTKCRRNCTKNLQSSLIGVNTS